MIEIPDVTLVAISGLNYQPQEHLLALEKSCKGIKFGAVKYIQSSSITNIDSWNKAVIYELPQYIQTSHALLVHPDGHVINPEMWDDQWLDYDYAGAPWPLPTDNYSYRDEDGEIQRVGNSVGLRSKRLMILAAQREWKSYYGNTNEDGFISCHNRKWLEKHQCKFMPFPKALHFSKETELPENKDLKTFLFHDNR
jgi:hypothetical protein